MLAADRPPHRATPAGPPLQPLSPINLLGSGGSPVRNDNLTSFAYVGANDGRQEPPETYIAYRPGDPSSSTPIQPGETTQLKNAQTGKYCRLVPLPPGFPSPNARCNTQGMLCDQDSLATATTLTYTGSGLSYNGVPLVEMPPSRTLVLSADPACTLPGGDKLTFPPALLGELPSTLAVIAVMNAGVDCSLTCVPLS